jgi:hypothetical protein
MTHWGSSFINFKLGDGRGEYKLPVYIQVSGLKKIVSKKHFPCFLRGILNKVVTFLHLFTLSSAEVSMSFTWRLPYRTAVWKTRRRRRGKQEASRCTDNSPAAFMEVAILEHSKGVRLSGVTTMGSDRENPGAPNLNGPNGGPQV